MAKQLNIFVENKPGRFRKITAILCDAGINIRAIEIQDRGEYGIMKLLVSDPHKAHMALTDAGLAVALKDVVAIVIDDQPGGLLKLAEAFEHRGINMVDAYGFVIESTKQAVWCVEVKEPEKVTRQVEDDGFRVLQDCELYEY
ncbi:MAG: ACT domain-containing protein [Spartobacteria bacterium]|nr:ACT domain-containing protein [Spartobacteria bacterium]